MSGRAGTAVAALGALWMIEGAGMAIGNAVGGIVAESVGPHLTLALGSLFALASPILFTIGMRGVLKPATPVTADAGPRRAPHLTRPERPASDCIAPRGCP